MSSYDPTEFICIDEYDYERFRYECRYDLDVQELDDSETHEVMEDDIPF